MSGASSSAASSATKSPRSLTTTVFKLFYHHLLRQQPRRRHLHLTASGGQNRSSPANRQAASQPLHLHHLPLRLPPRKSQQLRVGFFTCRIQSCFLCPPASAVPDSLSSATNAITLWKVPRASTSLWMPSPHPVTLALNRITAAPSAKIPPTTPSGGPTTSLSSPAPPPWAWNRSIDGTRILPPGSCPLNNLQTACQSEYFHDPPARSFFCRRRQLPSRVWVKSSRTPRSRFRFSDWWYSTVRQQ